MIVNVGERIHLELLDCVGWEAKIIKKSIINVLNSIVLFLRIIYVSPLEKLIVNSEYTQDS